jgi:hypothetical protein
MSPVTRKIQRLLVLFVFGALALNYPLLALFSKRVYLFGFPLLYLYLFTLWALFIICIAFVTETKKLPKTSFPPLFPRKPK